MGYFIQFGEIWMESEAKYTGNCVKIFLKSPWDSKEMLSYGEINFYTWFVPALADLVVMDIIG